MPGENKIQRRKQNRGKMKYNSKTEHIPPKNSKVKNKIYSGEMKHYGKTKQIAEKKNLMGKI